MLSHFLILEEFRDKPSLRVSWGDPSSTHLQRLTWLLPLPQLLSQGTWYGAGCRRRVGRPQRWHPIYGVRSLGGGGQGLAAAVVQAHSQANEQRGQEEGSCELQPQQGC